MLSSFWDIGILRSELVSVYFWYTAHRGIAVFLTASFIPPSTEQNWERYKKENESLKVSCLWTEETKPTDD